jgi:hypothetical protein
MNLTVKCSILDHLFQIQVTPSQSLFLLKFLQIEVSYFSICSNQIFKKIRRKKQFENWRNKEKETAAQRLISCMRCCFEWRDMNVFEFW